MVRTWLHALGICLPAACTLACASESATSSTSDLVSDVLSIDRNDDGTFLVRCLDAATGSTYTEPNVSADQILRNEVCGRSGATPGVRVTYACGAEATVSASVLAADGSEKSVAIPTGDLNTCRSVTAKLTEKRSLVTSTTLIGICATDATVRRLSITPAGDVRELDPIVTGDWNRCRAKEAQINDAPMTTTSAVRGSFTCVTDAEVLAQFLLPDGTERSVKLATNDWNRCRAVTETLNRARATITGTMLFALCDPNATLRRFSITSAGELTELASIATGNWNACDAREAEANR